MNTHLNSVTVDHAGNYGEAVAPRVAAAAITGHATTRRFSTLALVAVAATFSVATAHASCAEPRTPRAAQPLVTLPAPADSSAFRGGPANEDIVGTWLVTYSARGAAAGQAYIQWCAGHISTPIPTWSSLGMPANCRALPQSPLIEEPAALRHAAL